MEVGGYVEDVEDTLRMIRENVGMVGEYVGDG